jgi:hypothetical protein
MALLSSVESAPRAYRLKASNAASPISTSRGTIPRKLGKVFLGVILIVARCCALLFDCRWRSQLGRLIVAGVTQPSP